MGAFIAKQPNGLYCRFSTVVDTVTNWNMSKEDYVNLCVSKAIENAIEEAEKTLKNELCPFENIKDYFFPGNNTIEEFNQILKEMGDENGLGTERIDSIKKILKEQED